MILKRLIAPNGQVPILIRDDDTNFFTEPKMLESLYSQAWNNKFKVCLSVVPLLKGRNDISMPPHARTTDKYYSIVGNRSLLNYLKDKVHHKHIVEILQHGLTHDYNYESRRWEFGDDSKHHAKMKEDIIKGIGIIREAFDYEPRFFVPPGEDLSMRNMKMIRESQLIPIYRQTLFDRLLRNAFIPRYTKKFLIRQTTRKYSGPYPKRLFVKPVVMSASTNAISWSGGSIDSFDSFFELINKIIKLSIKERTPICVLNHYHLYYYDWNSTITKYDLFRAWEHLLKCFEKIKNSWKVTFSELYDRMQAIQSVDIAKTGSKITIQSKSSVSDFAFKPKHQIRPDDSIVIDEDANVVVIRQLSPQNRIVLYEKG